MMQRCKIVIIWNLWDSLGTFLDCGEHDGDIERHWVMVINVICYVYKDKMGIMFDWAIMPLSTTIQHQNGKCSLSFKNYQSNNRKNRTQKNRIKKRIGDRVKYQIKQQKKERKRIEPKKWIGDRMHRNLDRIGIEK